MIDKLKEASAHLNKANEILAQIIELENEEKTEKKAPSIQIVLKGIVDDGDELTEQLKKDLEEMLNDITEERKG